MHPCDNSCGLSTWLPSALRLWQIKAKLFSPETGEIQTVRGGEIQSAMTNRVRKVFISTIIYRMHPHIRLGDSI